MMRHRYPASAFGRVLQPLMAVAPRALRIERGWTAEELATMHRDYAKRGARHVAGLLQRPKGSVIGKARRLGLCKPRAAKEARA